MYYEYIHHMEVNVAMNCMWVPRWSLLTQTEGPWTRPQVFHEVEMNGMSEQ